MTEFEKLTDSIGGLSVNFSMLVLLFVQRFSIFGRPVH